MENLNTEQIIKALECCKTPSANDCEACKYDGKCLENGEYLGCVNLLIADALSLIKELTEEVALKVITLVEFDKQIERLTEENARLIKALEKMATDHDRAIRLTEVHTIRKMREKVNKKILEINYNLQGLLPFIDQIANEISEETK